MTVSCPNVNPNGTLKLSQAAVSLGYTVNVHCQMLTRAWNETKCLLSRGEVMAAQYVEFGSLEASKKTAKYLAMTILVVNMLEVSGDTLSLLGLTVQYSREKLSALLEVLLWVSVSALLLHWVDPVLSWIVRLYECRVRREDEKDTAHTQERIDPGANQEDDPGDEDDWGPPQDPEMIKAVEDLRARVAARGYCVRKLKVWASRLAAVSRSLTSDLALLGLVVLALWFPSTLANVVEWKIADRSPAALSSEAHAD